MFEHLFGGRDWWPWPEIAERFVPALEAYVEDGKFHVRAEVPGVDPKSIEVSALGNTLTIKGERKRTKETKEEGYYLREMAYGSFERVVTVPEGAETDKVSARYDKGVLHITVPVKEAITAKKVPIEVTAGEKELKAA
jgi:HSP20 family protein